MQTSFEVIDGLLRKKPVERVGLYEIFWEDTLKNWVKEGYPKDDKGAAADPCEHFGLDMAYPGGSWDIMPLKGVSEVVEESEEWVIKRNGAGAELKWWKNKSGTPEHMRFRMTSREIWDKDYRPHLLGLDRGRIADIPGTKEKLAKQRAQGKWTHYGHLFVWEHMRETMGDVTLYENMALDPGWIHDFCRVHTDFYKTHYKVILEEAGLPDGMWLYEDLGYRSGLFCSPKMFEELIFPYYRELLEFFHSYNLPVILHSCGGVEAALPMIVDVGFDALHPMERKADCDPFKFAAKFGDKLAFVGGLDVRVLESGDRNLIRAEVAKLIDGMKAVGARFVFSSDHSVSSNVKLDDYRCALETYREHMMY
jgi:uroporphyrinogen decarboxylase